MPRAKCNRKLAWVSGAFLFIVAAGSTVYLLKSGNKSNDSRTTPGRNILSGITGTEAVLGLLADLAWPDIAPTAEGIGTNKALADQIVVSASELQHSPALYLRGLLLAAADEPRAALATFNRIPPAEIPPAFLYAPYRLHNTLEPALINPFRAAMNQAVAAEQVPPLVQARVLWAEGSLPDSLKAYLKTDPAAWTRLDVQAFNSLRLHAALANSAAVMLQGALKGGRVPADLRTNLISILNAPRDRETLETLKAELLAQMHTNPALQAAAATAAVRQLASRQLFVGKKYQQLLDQCRDRNPFDLPDESVLMLMLSAARLKDSHAFDQWSQELSRRYPTASVKRWIEELRTPAQ